MEIHPMIHRAIFVGLHANATTPERWPGSVNLSIARQPVTAMKSLGQPRMDKKYSSRMEW